MIARLFKNSFLALRKVRGLIFVNIFITILTLTVGFYLSSLDNAVINEFKDKLLVEIQSALPLEEIYGLIAKNNIIGAIAITFGINLASGAFLSTTLTGIIFPLPALVMAERGIFIGLLFESEKGNLAYYILLIGTFILEFGAYVLSASAGINIGLSFFNPKRYKVKNAWQAFINSLKEAIQIYLWVIILLGLGAVWEICGISFLTK